MIPQRLELTNFLSYRQTTILDFQGIHLACIAGPNGAGKSSILDGMTWALFGKSRSRSDDDVVNRTAAGLSEPAEVRFEFDLEAMRYRVIRRKKAGGSSELDLQFQANGKWETLTEGKLRETQTAIIDLLRMNYDTFTNASFLLQGQADEFTTKTPGKRKEILADLLGVSRWDLLRDVAASRKRDEQNSLLLLDARMADIEQELQEEGTRRDALAVTQAEFEAVSVKLESMEALLGNQRRIAELIAHQEQSAKQMQQLLARRMAGLASLMTTQAERQKEREEFAAILLEADDTRAAQEAYKSAVLIQQQWQEKATQFSALQQEKRPYELTIERVRSSLAQQEQTLLRRATEVEQMTQERVVLAEQDAKAGRMSVTLSEQLARLSQQEQRWHEARAALQTLEGERELHQKELAHLQAEQTRIVDLQREQTVVTRNLEQATAALEDVGPAVAALSEQRQQHAAKLGERDNLRAEQPRLREEMDELSERIARLEKETGGQCPLCGQELSTAHRRQVLEQLRRDGQGKGDRFRANQTRLAVLQQENDALDKALKNAGRLEKEQQMQQQRQATAQARLVEITRRITEWEAEGPQKIAALQALLADDGELRERRATVAELQRAIQDKQRWEAERKQVEERAAEIRARLAEIERATTTWADKESAELQAVSQRLRAEAFDAEAQDALIELDRQIEVLGYDSRLHQEAKAEQQRLSAAEARYRALQKAEAAIGPLDRSLKDLREQVAAQESDVSDLQGQVEEIKAQIAGLKADSGDLRSTESEVLALREEKVEANRRIGAAQQRLSVLETLREQRKGLQKERAEQTMLIQRLERLEKACGRDGVQALLIEQALPEIESDTNDLLERLTAGDMRITFETQRQLKSRDALAETLELKISDVMGERPYENYSGGEQFRINFAVRLALSRILARRAGARLQTLVIDEGFGSQDPIGRQRLVEAINTIQDGFARILVITHIDELRDAFPNRIEVSKGRAGSQIALY